MKILFIDDDPEILLIVSKTLGGYDAFQVTTASSAREGLDLALRIRPDVIVSDFWMEDFDGDRLLEYLLRDSRTRSIPVILLTAKDSPETIERLFALGARKVISKPFVPSRLAEVIRDIADS